MAGSVGRKVLESGALSQKDAEEPPGFSEQFAKAASPFDKLRVRLISDNLEDGLMLSLSKHVMRT